MNLKTLNDNQTFKFILLVAILALCWFLGSRFDIEFEEIKEILHKYPLWLSGIIFVIFYVITTTFMWFGPKDVFRISAAFLFGAYVSTLFVWIAEMIDAVIMFYLSRLLGQNYVEQKYRIKEGQLAKAKSKTSALEIFAWRINPLIPFRIMDLGFGITKVNFRKYYIVIVAASLPRIFWLQYIMATVGEGMYRAIGAKMEILKEREHDISGMIDYMLEISATMNKFFLQHLEIIIYSMLYFLFVIIITIVAVIIRAKRKSAR